MCKHISSFIVRKYVHRNMVTIGKFEVQWEKLNFYIIFTQVIIFIIIIIIIIINATVISNLSIYLVICRRTVSYYEHCQMFLT